VGCGTGTDALFFVEHGRSVVALDPSPEMLAVAQEKILFAGFANAIAFRQGGAERLNEVLANYGAASFDGVFSNFGALNCIAGLETFARVAARLVRPGGKVLLSIMPPICPWEIGYYLSKRQHSQSFRRWRGRAGTSGIAVRLGNRSVRTYYHSSAEVSQAFANTFAVEKQFTLGLLAPPPYLHAVARYPKTFRALLRCEELIAGWPLLRSWGDHVVIVLRKRGT
jgi:ubiquinone/menaquinone biosynthesis C-methylase UbiE